MKIKPRTLQKILEGLHQIGQRFGCGRSGVHGLDAVVFGLGEEGVGGVHQKTLALAFAAAMAVSPKLLRVEKLCVWFAVMLISAWFRALDILRHGRGEELDGIGLVVGLGGEDQSLAPQVFVATGGDVGLDGLTTLWRVDAEGGVLLGGFV